jgi:hypothetical protein
MPGGAGIPDGSTIGRIVVDHRASCIVTVPTNGNFWIRTFPFLPYMMGVRGDGVSGTPWAGLLVDGVAVTSGAAANYSDNINWCPACIPPEWLSYIAQQGYGSPLPEVTNPYSAMRARIVTQALRVYYTGNIWTSTGYGISYFDTANLGDVQTNNMLVVSIENGQANGNLAINNVRVAPYDFTLRYTAVPGSRTFYPSEALHVNIPFVGTEHDFKKVYSTPVILYDTTSVASVFNHIATVQNQYGQAFIDTNWQSASMRFQGLVPGATVRFEMAMCMEYEPQQSSGYATFTKPAPKAPIAAIVAVDEANNSNPITPINNSKTGQGVLDKAASTIAAGASEVIRTAQDKTRPIPRDSYGRPVANAKGERIVYSGPPSGAKAPSFKQGGRP